MTRSAPTDVCLMYTNTLLSSKPHKNKISKKSKYYDNWLQTDQRGTSAGLCSVWYQVAEKQKYHYFFSTAEVI